MNEEATNWQKKMKKKRKEDNKQANDQSHEKNTKINRNKTRSVQDWPTIKKAFGKPNSLCVELSSIVCLPIFVYSDCRQSAFHLMAAFIFGNNFNSWFHSCKFDLRLCRNRKIMIYDRWRAHNHFKINNYLDLIWSNSRISGHLAVKFSSTMTQILRQNASQAWESGNFFFFSWPLSRHIRSITSHNAKCWKLLFSIAQINFRFDLFKFKESDGERE